VLDSLLKEILNKVLLVHDVRLWSPQWSRQIL